MHKSIQYLTSVLPGSAQLFLVSQHLKTYTTATVPFCGTPLSGFDIGFFSRLLATCCLSRVLDATSWPPGGHDLPLAQTRSLTVVFSSLSFCKDSNVTCTPVYKATIKIRFLDYMSSLTSNNQMQSLLRSLIFFHQNERGKGRNIRYLQ